MLSGKCKRDRVLRTSSNNQSRQMIPLDKDILAAANEYVEPLYGERHNSDTFVEEREELRKNRRVAIAAFCAGARWKIIDDMRQSENIRICKLD
jgi:hypothetical protein